MCLCKASIDNNGWTKQGYIIAKRLRSNEIKKFSGDSVFVWCRVVSCSLFIQSASPIRLLFGSGVVEWRYGHMTTQRMVQVEMLTEKTMHKSCVGVSDTTHVLHVFPSDGVKAQCKRRRSAPASVRSKTSFHLEAIASHQADVLTC